MKLYEVFEKDGEQYVVLPSMKIDIDNGDRTAGRILRKLMEDGKPWPNCRDMIRGRKEQ